MKVYVTMTNVYITMTIVFLLFCHGRTCCPCGSKRLQAIRYASARCPDASVRCRGVPGDTRAAPLDPRVKITFTYTNFFFPIHFFIPDLMLISDFSGKN